MIFFFTWAGALKVGIHLGAILGTKQDGIREWNMMDRLGAFLVDMTVLSRAGSYDH